MKAKVRGIYSTALTKLLLENGFQVVQPSPVIEKRFHLKSVFEPPDIDISDRYDLQGVHAMGTREAVDRFIQLLQSNLKDVITRRWSVSVDGIYKGKIVEKSSNAALVDIGTAVGKLPETLSNQNEVIVQVERRRIGAKNPLLTTKIKIPGKYAILIPEQKIGVSLKIRNLQERARLYALGRVIKPEGWGIIWRETAANQPQEKLEAEILELVGKAKQVVSLNETAEAPSLLMEGLYCLDVEFPASSKAELDKLRSTVTPTLMGHHHYKACSGRISALLEMAEKLLENGKALEEVEEEFRAAVKREYPDHEDSVQVQHVKLSGRVFLLGEATIRELSGSRLHFQRTLKRDGIYDGLRVPKKAGDKAVTEAEIGSWTLKTRYYSPEGKYKGTYININTPIELYPNAIRYVDLEVDICLWPDNTYKILDMEKLESALNKGWISRALYEAVKQKVEEIVQQLNGQGFHLKE